MSFQATVRDELRGEGGGGALYDTTKVGVPFRAAKHKRRNSAAVTSATISMQTNRHTNAFLLLSWCLKNIGPKYHMPTFEKRETLVTLELCRGGI